MGSGLPPARVPGIMVKRFECLFCDHCCFFKEDYEMPTVYPWEKRLLEEEAEKRGLHLEFEPLTVYRDREGRCAIAMYRWVIRGYCPFFDRETKKCTIHESKPLACRMYPLLVELPSGKLMLSGKCDWVRREKGVERLLARRPDLIGKVFPSELEAAKQAFIEMNSIMRFVAENGLERVRGVEECREVYDIDDYIARYG